MDCVEKSPPVLGVGLTNTTTSEDPAGSVEPELSPECRHKDKLIKLLKKEVKLIMEESVMLKTVHEDSASVNSLCAVVDTCLSLGLKRRALGLFKTR